MCDKVGQWVKKGGQCVTIGDKVGQCVTMCDKVGQCGTMWDKVGQVFIYGRKGGTRDNSTVRRAIISHRHILSLLLLLFHRNVYDLYV